MDSLSRRGYCDAALFKRLGSWIKCDGGEHTQVDSPQMDSLSHCGYCDVALVKSLGFVD